MLARRIFAQHLRATAHLAGRRMCAVHGRGRVTDKMSTHTVSSG
jgi:hypothetical protein